MKKYGNAVEIRWHGRGGQGAKTACLLLADVCFNSGKQVQGFPEYGPERMGAPITAYNRISDKPNLVHSNIYYPDYVVVVDESLLESVDVTAGLSEDGAIIVNTVKSPRQIRQELSGYKGRVCTVDAASISLATIGKNIPNTPMLAAIVKISGYVSLGSIVAAALVPVLAWQFGYPVEYIGFGVLAAAFIIIRHHANIGRLLSGTESKIKAGHR